MSYHLRVFLIEPAQIIVYSLEDSQGRSFVYNAGSLDQERTLNITGFVEIEGYVTDEFGVQPVVLGNEFGNYQIVYAPNDSPYVYSSDGYPALHQNHKIVGESVIQMPNVEQSQIGPYQSLVPVSLTSPSKESIKSFVKQSYQGKEQSNNLSYSEYQLQAKSAPSSGQLVNPNQMNLPSSQVTNPSPPSLPKSSAVRRASPAKITTDDPIVSIQSDFDPGLFSKVPTPKPETPKAELKVPTPKPETPKPELKVEPKVEPKPEPPKVETKPELPKVETKPQPKAKRSEISPQITIDMDQLLGPSKAQVISVAPMGSVQDEGTGEPGESPQKEIRSPSPRTQPHPSPVPPLDNEELEELRKEVSELREIVRAMNQRLYRIYPVNIPPELRIDGKLATVISVQDIRKKMENDEIERYLLDPMFQAFAGSHRTNNRFLTFYSKDGSIYLVRADYNPQSNEINAPE